MRRFMENYGLYVLAFVVLILVIIVMSPLGGHIKDTVNNWLNLEDQNTGEVSGNLGNEINSKLYQQGKEGDFKVVLTAESITDQFDIYFKTVKPDSGWVYVDRIKSDTKTKELIFHTPIDLPKRIKVQVKIVKVSPTAEYISNILNYEGKAITTKK